MLRSEDTAIHYEAVGVIGNLVHSSPNIKKEVLAAGALQPVIGLLSSSCSESQREAALLLGQFAATDSDCKVHIVQRGAVPPLIDMLHSPDSQLREMSAFALGRLAQVTHDLCCSLYLQLLCWRLV
nr:ARM REPEAT PROTEIN INTERACTING WITH ABF2-like [Ipomoea batatas]